jgi:uncharacterized paraquat-inducible protein A
MAINLYKEMIAREDSIIRLLMDIRDNTKKFESTIEPVVASASYQDEEYHCEKCNAIIPPDAKKCPKCGVEFE